MRCSILPRTGSGNAGGMFSDTSAAPCLGSAQLSSPDSFHGSRSPSLLNPVGLLGVGRKEPSMRSPEPNCTPSYSPPPYKGLGITSASAERASAWVSGAPPGTVLILHFLPRQQAQHGSSLSAGALTQGRSAAEWPRGGLPAVSLMAME